jgi:hypothetical protein
MLLRPKFELVIDVYFLLAECFHLHLLMIQE